jgi:hypothetical protein
MTTIEIIANFMKGNTKVTITEKQKNWLTSQAKNESVLNSDGWHDSIYFEDCFYQIKQCKTLSSGGSYVGTKFIQGKYNIEKLFTIKFTENSQHTAVYGLNDLKSFERDNIKFEIITPYRNTKTK